MDVSERLPRCHFQYCEVHVVIGELKTPIQLQEPKSTGLTLGTESFKWSRSDFKEFRIILKAFLVIIHGAEITLLKKSTIPIAPSGPPKKVPRPQK